MRKRISREWANKLRPYAGQWVAFNREETKVIAVGRTFDDAKQAAYPLGERELYLAEVPSANRWNRLLPPVLHNCRGLCRSDF